MGVVELNMARKATTPYFIRKTGLNEETFLITIRRQAVSTAKEPMNSIS